MLGKTLLKSWSRTQKSTAQSTMEAEFMAMDLGVTEAMHIVELVKDVTNDNKKCRVTVCTDRRAAKSFAGKLGKAQTKAKHIALRHLFVQEQYQIIGNDQLIYFEEPLDAHLAIRGYPQQVDCQQQLRILEIFL